MDKEQHSHRPDTPTTTTRGTILVLEDEFALRMLIRILLEAEGYTIMDTDDGFEAMELVLRAGKIDLLIVNLRMPIMSGAEFLTRLQELPAVRRPPVLVVTGCIDATDQVDCAELGITGILRKPFKRKDLIQQVNTFVNPPPLHTEQPIAEDDDSSRNHTSM